MNVLSLTSSYPRYDGDPTAPFIESITKHVAALGHAVHVVLPEHHAWRRPKSEDGVTYHHYRYSPSRSRTPWGYSSALERGIAIRKPLYALAPVVALSAVRELNRLLARERFDVVNAHWVIPNGPIAAFAAKRHGVPLVVSLHGSDISVSERSRGIARVTRSTFARAAAVTAPSENLLGRARRLGARGQLEVIPYGADVAALTASAERVTELRARLGLPVDRIVVVGIGRFVAMKGFPYLVDAVARARVSQPAVHLVLVGDGDMRTELENRVRSLGVETSVTFTGMVDRDLVAASLGLAEVVVVPSIHADTHVDGLPNVALEAMAAGKPLVATRVGGLPQLVRDGTNGLLVDEKDPAALADAILRLAADPSLRARLGEEARREILTERSWDVVAEQFVEVYARAAHDGRLSPADPAHSKLGLSG